jgi:hypothetical protein
VVPIAILGCESVVGFLPLLEAPQEIHATHIYKVVWMHYDALPQTNTTAYMILFPAFSIGMYMCIAHTLYRHVISSLSDFRLRMFVCIFHSRVKYNIRSLNKEALRTRASEHTYIRLCLPSFVTVRCTFTLALNSLLFPVPYIIDECSCFQPPDASVSPGKSCCREAVPGAMSSRHKNR